MFDRRPTMSADPYTLALLGAFVGFGLALRAQRRARHRVRGKVVLVTGGSRGLGLEIARELGKRGARVAIVARQPDELLRAEAELESHGIEVLALTGDVTRPDDVSAVLHRICDAWGPVDVLVNNAGRIEVGPVEHMTIEDYVASMDLHFWAPLHLTCAVLPDMRVRGRGHVVNIASVGGVIALPHMVPYSASKHALVGLSRGLAAELADDGITVTTVIPSRIRTGSVREARFKGRVRQEYAWFALTGAIPGIATSVRHAARRIRRAIERGDREVVIGAPARLAKIVELLVPEVMEIVGRLLPRPGGVGADARAGDEIRFLPPRRLERHAE